MPNYAQNDIVLYTVRYTMLGQVFLNTMHYAYQSDITGNDDVKGFNDALLAKNKGAGGFIPALRLSLSQDIIIEEHLLQVIYPNRYVPQRDPINLNGTIAPPAMPLNTAFVLTKMTQFATRWGQGSWHQPGMPEESRISAGKWDAPDIVVMETTLKMIMLGPQKPQTGVGNLKPIVWGIEVPGRTSEIVAVRGQETIRVMRRRTIGVGK